MFSALICAASILDSRPDIKTEFRMQGRGEEVLFIHHPIQTTFSNPEHWRKPAEMNRMECDRGRCYFFFGSSFLLKSSSL